MSNPSRTLVLSRLTRRLMTGHSRAARAPLYLELVEAIGETRAAVVVWRRRASAHQCLFGETRPFADDYEESTPAYNAVATIEGLAEGEAQVSALDVEWAPAGINPIAPARLYLPEGRRPGALRLLVQGLDDDAAAELSAFLKGLRPHWVQRRRLRREAAVDHLTGVYNYGHLKRTLTRACEGGDPFSVIMLDLDHLREYNAQFGHLMGSQVLAQLGRILRQTLRDGDFVAKYGGDEFVVILHGAAKPDAAEVAFRLKDAVARSSFFGVTIGFITCSFGVATYGEDGDTFETLLRSANQAIFAAKDRGRNTIVVAGR